MRFIGAIFAISLIFGAANAFAQSSDSNGSVDADSPTLPPNITRPLPDGSHSAASFYPEEARHLNEQGTVGLTFTVTDAGAVDNPSILESSGFADLDEAAIQAVKTWRYKPATKDSKPIPVRTTANVKFELSDTGDMPPPGYYYQQINMAVADYPPAALAAKEEGKVKIRIGIAADGGIASAVLESSSGVQILDLAAMSLALTRWRFTPAMRDGKPVLSSTLLIINWQLPSTQPVRR